MQLSKGLHHSHETKDNFRKQSVTNMYACTFACHVPLSFVTNTVKSVKNLASAKNARKSIQSKTANVNVSPPFYMVVRFKLECYWYTLQCITWS